MLDQNTLLKRLNFGIKGKTTLFFPFLKNIVKAFSQIRLPVTILLWGLFQIVPSIGQQNQARNTIVTIPAGSWIIDMGVNPQTQNNALKPYGLVYELLSNQIPVIWSIKPGKGRGEADFVGPTGKMKGGPFIISSEFAAKAAPIINQPKWAGIVKTQLDWARGNIPVYATLRAQPRWSINGKSDKKALDYFEWADIPDTAYEDDIDPANLNECIDIFIVPHDNIQSNFITSTSIWNAPPSRGFIWFGCESGGTPGDWLSTGSTPFEPDG